MFLALAVAVIRLTETRWSPELAQVDLAVLVASALGFALGKSAFKPWVVAVMGTVFTMFFVPTLLAFPLAANLAFEDQLNNLAVRLGVAVCQFRNQLAVSDSIFFLVFMFCFFWFASFFACYQLTRHGKPWLSVTMVAVAFILMDYFSPQVANRDQLSFFFVLFVLLLAGRLYILRQKARWAAERMEVEADTGYVMSRSAVLLGGALMLTAWLTPVVVDVITPGTQANSEFQKWVAQFEDDFGNLIGRLENPVIQQGNALSNSFGLGRGGELTEEIAFTVTLPQGLPSGVRFYWRGRSYDTYVNGQWTSKIDNRIAVEPGIWSFPTPDYIGRTQVDLSYTIYQDQIFTIYAPSQPVALSSPALVQGEIIGNADSDLVGLLSAELLRPGDTLRMYALVSSPTILELRQSGQDYPQWVKDRYLQLPLRFPQRMRDLAEELTRGVDNPYDKVMAITNHLRKTITYEGILSARVPPDQDPVDWFLFDYQRGFCNYYASAEVLLLRSIGIPARLAIGYAQGEYDPNTRTFTVRDKSSHAWPEVYFAGVGWVEFEPTVSEPPTSLRSGEAAARPTPGIQPTQPIPLDPDEIPTLPPRVEPTAPATKPDLSAQVAARGMNDLAAAWVLFVLLTAGEALFAWFWLTRRPQLLTQPLPLALAGYFRGKGWELPSWLARWERDVRSQPVERLFKRVNWMLRLLGERTSPASTPAERVARLVLLAPPAGEPAAVLLDEYQRSIYGPYPVDLERARRANAECWRKVLACWVKKVYNQR